MTVANRLRESIESGQGSLENLLAMPLAKPDTVSGIYAECPALSEVNRAGDRVA